MTRTDQQAEAAMAKWMDDNEQAIVLGGVMYEYIKDRAQAEGTPFELTLGLFVQAYLEGVREFFGATLHTRRNGDWAITDCNQPKRGYTKRWLDRHFPREAQALRHQVPAGRA